MNILSSKRNLFVAIAVVLLVIYLLIQSISRSGKTEVSITAIPEDAKVFINDKASRSGTHYLKPGNYTFKAQIKGYKDDVVTINITDESQEVGLIPDPDSEDAVNYLKDNPRIQQERERIGGLRTNAEGSAREEQTPLIRLLPVTEINGPFSIDYGPSDDRKDGVFLVVTDSAPGGRREAVEWMRERGADPTKLEIRWADFTNPLEKRQ